MKNGFYILAMTLTLLCVTRCGTKTVPRSNSQSDGGAAGAVAAVGPCSRGNGYGFAPFKGYGVVVAHSIAIQSDAKIVVAGDDGFGNFSVARFNGDCTLDNSFGQNGVETLSFPPTVVSRLSGVSAAIVGGDGKIILAGMTIGEYPAPASTGLEPTYTLVRLNADGTPDGSFGQSGWVLIEMPADFFPTPNSGYYAQVNTLSFVPTGILVGGTCVNNSLIYNCLVELDRSGNLVPSFGQNGIAQLGGDGATWQIMNFSVLSGGTYEVVAATGYSMPQVFLESPQGSPLTPPVEYAIPNTSDPTQTTAATLSPDGKVLYTSGYTSLTSGDFNYVDAHNADGSVDAAFGSGGSVLWPLGYLNYSQMMTQPDGKILLVGYTSTVSQVSQFLLNRLNIDGSFDSSFGTNGAVTFGSWQVGNQVQGQAMALQPDGKILVAGNSVSGGNYGFVLARFLTNGQPDL